MNILELCLSPGLGGLELYVARCAEALSGKHRVIGVTSTDTPLIPYLERVGTALHHLPASRVRAAPLFNARRLAALIDREQVDVVHMHWGKDLPLAALAKRLSRRRPALVYTRQMQVTRPKDDFYHNVLYGQMDVMVTISERLAADARRFLGPYHTQKVRTLYYGVPEPKQALSREARRTLRDEWGVPDGAFLVGLFARIESFKGQHLLLEAVERAVSDDIPLYALIVGQAMDGDYLASLKARAESGGYGDRVVICDFVDDPQRWMQACDAVALTTYEETFGLVLPEAMRAGVAVVGSNAGGVPEIIDDDETGLLFQPGDAQDLYAQLSRLALHGDLRKRLAAAGKAKADSEFNPGDHFSRLEAILQGASGAF
ncbi:glycosyltransferase family 4 protein [Thiohalomonas denitrificans]|uniref:glycosyltransferase family 4 protein n=1 Tax=Thiohalomonas denitrificans TaxID=415747 RepID=UPI0026EF16FE|nr:glycosyltransferase family 4 protein [Thiohalomonas denitrificans]